MAFENISGDYTETDPNSQISATTTRATGTLITYQNATYFSKDFGAGFFSGDFEFDFTWYNAVDSAANATVQHFPFMLSNVLAGYQTHIDADNDLLSMDWAQSTGNTRVVEWDGASGYADTYAAANDNVIHYCTMIRDEAIGTYGRFYLDLYSDSGRTTVLDNLFLDLHTSKKDFRNIQLLNNRDNGTNSADKKWSGYVEDVDLAAGATGLGIPLIMHDRRMRYNG